MKLTSATPKPLLLAFLVVCAQGTAPGADADFDYGRAADMRGTKTIYIDTSLDLNIRNDLADRIEKATLLRAVTKDESPDLMLAWTSRDQNCGDAGVIRLRPAKRPLLVFQWKDCGKRFVPATFLFVRKFAAAFNEVNK